jgi:hypothetical protein
LRIDQGCFNPLSRRFASDSPTKGEERISTDIIFLLQSENDFLENGLILLLKVKIENQYFKNNIQYKFT